MFARIFRQSVAWMPERSALSRHGRLAAGVLGAQALAVALVAHPQAAPLARALEHAFVDPRFLRWTALAQPALLAFVVALAAVAVRFARRPRPLESGVLGALVAAFLALSVPGLGLVSTIYFATGGLILAVSLVEASHAMAFGDELTGLPGRRALNETLGEIEGQYAVAMVDVDHFKKFNDDHGHDVGDDLLRMVGARLGRVTGGGRAFRYGGEEFAVIFPGFSSADARPHAEALRQSIEGAEFTVRGPGRPRKRPGAAAPRTPARARKTVGVTVSVGLADAARRGATPPGVIKSADQALYRAKRAGRNRVSV
jgi:diguanylate cyclase (GGDEF)-like protein